MNAVTSIAQANSGMPAERHPRRPHLEDADDDLDAGRDGADLGDAQAEHPEVEGQVRARTRGPLSGV